MTASQKTAINVVFGAMTIGKPGIEMTRVTTLDDTKAILDVFQKHGHNEIDSARIYGQGSSEEYLSAIEWQKRGIVMDTKLYPNKSATIGYSDETYDHSPADLRAGLMASLKALKADRIDLWYLHGPDRKTPFEDTLREVDKLHQEGYFSRFGLSNFQSWEVAKVCEICIKNNWIRPTVYQGIYNALHRAVEPELLPCLRHYGISLYAFQPLAGGFLTGKFHRNQEQFEEGSRFDPKRKQGQLHHGRYWNEDYFEALDIIRPVIQKHGLTETEIALRWEMHHSVLKRELKDALIVGASSPGHLEGNLVDLEKGPLPGDVVEALDAGWGIVRRIQFKYWH